MKNKQVLIILIMITLIAAFLRFYKLADNPPALNIDEVSYAYDAYSILKTGRDQYGNFMPLSFRSVGDYKNPVLIYMMVPAITVFGLNEFATRATTAFFGVLSIPVFFGLILTLTKDKKLALIAAALLAISPWHIYYSRMASDHLLGSFWVMIGILGLIKMLEGGLRWALIAAFFLVLSMYTYHSERLFVPIFIFFFAVLNYKKLLSKKQNIWLFMITGVVLSLPLLFMSLFGTANIRMGMVFLSQDVEYTRYVIMDHLVRGTNLLNNENLLLAFFWVKRYLNYFQPDFLFFTGLNMTISSIGLGILYLFELPWLIWGIIELIKKKIPYDSLLVLWILAGIFPASLTNNEQSAGRVLLIIPPLILIVAVGVKEFVGWAWTLKASLKLIVLSSYSFVITILLIHAFLIFYVHFPLDRGDAFMEGSKESVLYALANKDKYDEVVYDPYRGLEAQDVVSIPHMYVLFYAKYDPFRYQQEINNLTGEYNHFDKFTFRRIDWREKADSGKTGVLFIGSPWSLPLKDLKPGEIQQKFYLSSGRLVLLAATPKK